jgi:hypothetical protein
MPVLVRQLGHKLVQAPIIAGLGLEPRLCRSMVEHPSAPKGNKHALKHGRYTAEAIASRREIAALIRAMRALSNATEEVSRGNVNFPNILNVLGRKICTRNLAALTFRYKSSSASSAHDRGYSGLALGEPARVTRPLILLAIIPR